MPSIFLRPLALRLIESLRDGVRFLLIIFKFKIATLYSPLKLLMPASTVLLLGCTNHAWALMHDGRLANGSAAMWGAAVLVLMVGLIFEVIVFLIALASEQIAALMYRCYA